MRNSTFRTPTEAPTNLWSIPISSGLYQERIRRVIASATICRARRVLPIGFQNQETSAGGGDGPWRPRAAGHCTPFLLLKDSRSSYAIEGERPPQDRIQRWARAIGEAGRRPVDLDELLRLQAIVIGDARFVELGLRREGGFVGEHDGETRMPIPDHVSARAEDLRSLIDGMAAFDRGPARDLDPVTASALLAFGFVYVHPFVDGNGRIHRYLIHHVLAQRGFNPAGVVFPSLRLSWNVSTNIATCWRAIPTDCCPLSSGNQAPMGTCRF